jgi:hypothetical protein
LKDRCLQLQFGTTCCKPATGWFQQFWYVLSQFPLYWYMLAALNLYVAYCLPLCLYWLIPCYIVQDYSRYDRQIGKSISKLMPTTDSVKWVITMTLTIQVNVYLACSSSLHHSITQLVDACF